MAKQELSQKFLEGLKNTTFSASRNAFKNAVMSNGIDQTALNQDALVKLSHTFSHEIKTGKITAQKKSGRCWLFAGLNLIRQQIAKDINVPDFELSQVYIEFYDQLEKANWFLETIIELRRKPLTDRKMDILLHSPIFDGGHWNFFSNLVQKYGVIPKAAMNETFHSEETMQMNKILSFKLREYAAELRSLHKQKKSEEYLRKKKLNQMKEFYSLLVHFLGKPPEEFDFEYRDEEKNFHKKRKLTPQKFTKEFVKFNCADYVGIVYSPMHPINKLYELDMWTTVQGMDPVFFLNVDNKTLKQLTLQQLKDEEPVWFAADVLEMSHRKLGVLDANVFLYEDVLGTKFKLKEPELFAYREVVLNHAMTFTGVNLVNGRPNRWKVENSWGDEVGKKGYFVMSDSWFDQFVSESIIHKKYLTEAQKKMLKQKPVLLEPWDPFAKSLRVQ